MTLGVSTAKYYFLKENALFILEAFREKDVDNKETIVDPLRLIEYLVQTSIPSVNENSKNDDEDSYYEAIRKNQKTFEEEIETIKEKYNLEQTQESDFVLVNKLLKRLIGYLDYSTEESIKLFDTLREYLEYNESLKEDYDKAGELCNQKKM